MDVSKLSGMVQQAQQRFKSADADGDGSLSRAEFEKARADNPNGRAVNQAFESLDGDGDGVVTQNEMRASAQAQIKAAQSLVKQAGGLSALAGGVQPDLVGAMTGQPVGDETTPAQQRLEEIEAVLNGKAPKSSLQFSGLIDKTA